MKENRNEKNPSQHPEDCSCPLCAARRACRGLSTGFSDPVQGETKFRAEGRNSNPNGARSDESDRATETERADDEFGRGRDGKPGNAHDEKRSRGRDGKLGCTEAHDRVDSHGNCVCRQGAVEAHGHGHAEARGSCACEHGREPACGNDCGCGHAHGGANGKAKTAVILLRVAVSAALLALGAFLPLPEFVELAFFIPAFLVIGCDVAFGAVKGLIKGKILDERLLMLIASVGAFAVSEAPEGVLVMLLYQIGEFLTELSLARSQKSISALTRLRPEFAVVLRGGAEIRVAPEEVAVGETVLVRPGERVPLDGVIRKGKTTVDVSALTGESVPVGKREGEEVLSGSVNTEGAVEIETTKPFGASAVMRILELVSEASETKPKSERFIKKFARYYTPAVVIAAVLIALIPPLAGLVDWARWIHTALVFLVVSCPCALVIAVPLTYFAGVGGASKRGILVKGGTVLDALKSVRTAVFDKTGTLTEGVFEVTAVAPADGVAEETLKAAAALAESRSNHPIAKSISAAFGNPNEAISDYKELAGRGISVGVAGKEILAGNAELMRERGVEFAEKTTGGSIVYVAADGNYLGAVVVSDRIKAGSAAAVAELKKLGIRSFMLTGDREGSAKETADAIGLDGFRAGLMPGDKVGALEELMRETNCAFIGDGVNDAPVITRANVGFAMGGIGQDAAIEAADVVLMDDKPENVAKTIRIARKTGRIAVENIVFALTVKAAVLVLGILGIANMWLAVFADMGVTLLAVFNALRAKMFLAKRTSRFARAGEESSSRNKFDVERIFPPFKSLI